jgi:hypothetical protein
MGVLKRTPCLSIYYPLGVHHRDLVAHPIKLRSVDLNHLEQLLQAPNSPLTGVSDAVSALIICARKQDYQ